MNPPDLPAPRPGQPHAAPEGPPPLPHLALPHPVVELGGVCKRYGKVTVLDHIDLAIPAGRVTAILGPNGAGKSTLIKSLLGLTKPDRGRMTVFGQVVDGDASYRHRIGYLPQAARFPENLTGREVLEMLRDVRGRPLGSDDFLLRHLELEPELDKPVRILSGGTQQKLNAVIAFLFHPALLILDEPTAGLDPIASVLLKDKIRRARDEGTTVVLTSHVLSEVEELADTVVFLLDGKVRFEGSVGQLRDMTGKASLERALGSLMTRLTP